MSARGLPRLDLGVVSLCALGSLIAAALAVGFHGEAPSWAHHVFYSLLVANAATVLLLWHRQWRWAVDVGVVVTVVGIYNIVAWDLLRTFSNLGLEFHPGRAVFYVVLPGLLMGTIGAWSLPRLLVESRITDDLRLVGGVAIGVVGLVAAAEYLAGGLSLVAILWAQGTGYYLIPLVVIGGIRLARETENGTKVTIGMLVVGLFVLLAAPLWRRGQMGTAVLCPGDTWASSLRYSIEWTTLRFSYSDGCNGRVFELVDRPALLGLFGTITGTVGTVVVSLRES